MQTQRSIQDTNNLLAERDQTDNGFARFLLSMPTGPEWTKPGDIGLELRDVEF